MAVTVYGVVALTFMMVMYALERRGRGFILGFAAGCVASSIYGFLAGAWPFGVVELIWSGIAVRRGERGPQGRETIPSVGCQHHHPGDAAHLAARPAI